ncbi:MAG: tRNA pseudouridine(55) synthase TruB [Oscillospiraceae bacterium]
MNGILLVDKPEGWTSHDVVAKLRGLLHERRIGHSGTLDPMATGLLVVFIGKATKAVAFAEADEKAYLATLRLGIVTDTQDTTGTILERRPVAVTETALDETLLHFTGEIAQIPPMYSAIKVDGQRLYKLARRGESVARRPRQITITRLERETIVGEEVSLSVTCSKGTYIRTLCHDIGESLGCGGAMSSLRRVRAGAFSVDDAYTMAQIAELAENGGAESALLPLDSLFSAYPAYTADPSQERKCRCGSAFEASLPDGTYRVYGEGGKFLMLAGAESGSVRAIKNFFEVE